MTGHCHDLRSELVYPLSRQAPDGTCHADCRDRTPPTIQHWCADTAITNQDFLILDRIAALAYDRELRFEENRVCNRIRSKSLQWSFSNQAIHIRIREVGKHRLALART